MSDRDESIKRDDLKECPFCDSSPFIQFKSTVVWISCIDPTCDVVCRTRDCTSASEAESIWQFRPGEIRVAAEKETNED